MTRSDSLVPVQPLFESNRGGPLSLPPNPTRLNGNLRMPVPRSGFEVFSNFVSTLVVHRVPAAQRTLERWRHQRLQHPGSNGDVMGKAFAPRDPLWGTPTDVRRDDSHLFLRYSF